MSIVVREVKNAGDLRRFVEFPYQYYKNHPLWLPTLKAEEREIFDPKKNPAYAYCESRQFLAEKDGKVVGRVAAVWNKRANEKFGTRNLRFGWFDAIDDLDVARGLFAQVETWAREIGMETVTGPHGFCDFDPNGMLVEGFDHMANTASNFNYPHYPVLTEKCGYGKEIDYLEFKVMVPHETGIPEKLLNLSERVKERSHFHLYKFRNVKHILSRADEIFDVLQEAYEEIYGAVLLTDEQIKYYIKKYITYIDPDLIKVVVNDQDKIVGFLITMPNMTKAFQKAKGRLFPFGWYWILRGLKQHEIIDFLLAGVRKQYRGQGVDLLMAVEISKTCLEKGFIHSESTQELETNTKVQAQWKFFNPVQHKRRRIYKKKLT